MKNRLLVLFLLAAAGATAGAQEKYVNEKATSNTFLSVGVGANASMYAEDGIDLGKVISPHVTVSLGKWITPSWAVRLQGGLWSDKLNSGFISGGPYKDDIQLAGAKEVINLTTGRIRLDGMFNLTNAIMGYNPDRLFSFSIFTGPGLTIANPPSKVDITTGNGVWNGTYSDNNLRMYVNASAGFLAKFNVSKYWDIDLEGRGEVTPAFYGTYGNNIATTGTLYLTLGATYTFGGKQFVKCGESVDMVAINDELNRYRKELSDAKAQIETQRQALANAQKAAPKEVVTVKEVEVPGPRAIFFKKGTSQMDDYSRVNLELAAKIMKANPNKEYKIVGYADKATGSVELNKRLTEKRAQVVCDELVALGVNKAQLKVIGAGGIDNMFGKDSLNRVVILE
ncbi:MAG: OmpA family protein [Mediterranea sp.]|jgi:outer membrane protein OmpA-like peptidoglycan-associated protein|nr:OmpA family protein [Mediterranea sp.]